jgi:hypothetical protein
VGEWVGSGGGVGNCGWGVISGLLRGAVASAEHNAPVPPDAAAHLDPLTVRSLVRVRSILEDAVGRAADPTEAGRHIAVVALDGAVEHALATACRHLGEEPKDTVRFEDLKSLAGGLLRPRGWNPVGLNAVNQLRKARNAAQHHALVPAADHMLDFAAGAEAYVDSVLGAAFDVRLADLHLALAIGDERYRNGLLAAERVLYVDAAESFDHCVSVFEAAREQWRSRRTGRVPMIAAPLATGDDALSTEDVLDIFPFSPRLDEWVWLKHTIIERQVGRVPSVEEARRAIRFVVGWVSRFEIFEHGYPEGGVIAWRDGIEPPVTPGGGPPRIIWGASHLFNDGMGNAQWIAEVQLADIPERGRGEWGVDLPQCFVDAANERGLWFRQSAVRRSLDGSLTVQFPAGVDGTDVARALKRAVELADERHVARITHAAKRAALREQVQRRWTDLIAPNGDVFAAIDVRDDMRADGEHLIVSIRMVGQDQQRDGMVATDAVRNMSGLWAGSGAGWTRDAIDLETWVDDPHVDDDDATRAEGLERAADAVRRQRTIVEDLDREFLSFTEALQRELGTRPPHA